jgi:hypothetical protein
VLAFSTWRLFKKLVEVRCFTLTARPEFHSKGDKTLSKKSHIDLVIYMIKTKSNADSHIYNRSSSR